MLHEAFVSALGTRRSEYNAQFLSARRASSELSDEAFFAFLRGSLDPLVASVAAVDRAAVLETVDAGYSIGLELVAQRLAGPRAYHGHIDRAFREVFPALARFVAAAPDALLPRLCNAVHQVASVPGARVADWLRWMAQLGPHVGSVEQLLELGQVCAWLCGLAHYRDAALALCQRLPEPLLGALLGVPPQLVGAALTRLELDPWHVPSSPALGSRLVGTFGGFRGFGGAFLSPPRVVRVERSLFVTSGDDAWLVTLDAFGCTLHRARPEELAGASADVQRADVTLGRSQLSVAGQTLPLPDTGEPSSAAGNTITLLFTTAHSYAVSVVALGAPP